MTCPTCIYRKTDPVMDHLGYDGWCIHPDNYQSIGILQGSRCGRYRNIFVEYFYQAGYTRVFSQPANVART